MTVRALVVDDEPRARSRLLRLLAAHADVVVVGQAATGAEAVRLVLSLHPDVVFLDVQMPELSGTDAADQLRDYLPPSVRPAVVFTTAHAEHAVRAFALEGTDYLLKPIERDRLAEALRRVRKLRWSASPVPVPDPEAPRPAEGFLVGHQGRALTSIPVGAVVSIQVEEGTAWAHTVDGTRTRLGGGLSEIGAGLDSPPFLQVSRAAIVNTARALRIRPVGTSFEVELEGGQRVAVSRRRVKPLQAMLGLG